MSKSAMGEIFQLQRAASALQFTGERWTTAASGQIEIEHLHRYFWAREACRGKDVLDIASGEGYGAALLAQVARHVIGIDLDPQTILHAQHQYRKDNLKYLIGDARRIPLADQSVDVVTSFETLEHFAEQEIFLEEIRRILRPTGILLISTPDSDVYSPIGGAANPYHVRELSREEFFVLLSQYFSNVALSAQRPFAGSVIIPKCFGAGASAPVTFERRDETFFERSSGLPRGMYLLGSATNCSISDADAPSLYIHSPYVNEVLGQDAAIAAQLTVARAEAEVEKARAESATAEAEAERARADAATAEILEVRANAKADASALVTAHEQSRAEWERRLNEWQRRVTEVEGARDRAETELATVRAAQNRDRVEREAELSNLISEKQELKVALAGAQQEVAHLRHELAMVLFSTAWQITLPVRLIGSKLPLSVRRTLRWTARAVWRTGTFKRLRAPRRARNTSTHDTEDHLAAFRSAPEPTASTHSIEQAPTAGSGLRLHSVHSEIRKYVSKGPLYEEFSPIATKPTSAKLLAYYLPQFHAIPENDEWWGKGFTEWRNLPRGVPRFLGHYQPRVPRDLGFYSLDHIETLRKQIELAQAAGIFGFVFYYYWFNGKKLLERPLDRFIHDQSTDMPFCLMWANENWSRRWDGSEDEVLISQDYHIEHERDFLAECSRYFKDRRYIRISNRPLLMVYRGSLIPDTRQTLERWRQTWRSSFDEDPILVMAQSFYDLDPRTYGFDGAIEFPPHKLTLQTAPINDELEQLDPEFSARVYRYSDLAKASLEEPFQPYPLIKTVVPGWDNDARRQGKGMSVTGSTPAQYEAWLSAVIERAIDRPFFSEAFVAINAWNEWCEGAYLEPDLYFGSAYLNATARAATTRSSLSGRWPLLLVGHDAFPSGAQRTLLHLGECLHRCFGLDVEFLLLDGGALEDRYRAAAPTIVVKDKTNFEDITQSFYKRGFRRALINTSAAAQKAEMLSKTGFMCTVLIHELPGIVKEKGLQEGIDASFRCAQNIVFPHVMVKDALISAYGFKADNRCLILPQGCYREVVVSTEGARRIREELKILGGELIVLGIGYADERKGFDLFLQMWRLLRTLVPKLHCCWVGGIDPELERKLKTQIEEARQTGTFHQVGHRTDVDAFLSAANCLALTSREDPFPTVALEAWAAGIPVFAFLGSGGIPTLLEDRSLGAAVAYCNVGAMAREIADFLARGDDDASQQQRRRLIAERFDQRSYSLALLKLIYPELAMVSVAVPNYNYEKFLPDRLASIFQQSYPVREILVLDDASSDGSVAIAQQTAAAHDREIRMVVNNANSGSPFFQWRRAAREATAEYLWIAEADDLADNNFLAGIMPLFNGDESIALAFCDSRAVHLDGSPMWSSYKEYYASLEPGALTETQIFEGPEFVTKFLAVKNVILNVSSVIWRRDVLLAALDRCWEDLQSYRLAGDWRLYIEALSAAGAKIAYHSGTLNVHRRHSQSITHSLDPDKHIKEVERCQNAVRRDLGCENIREQQLAYLTELRATLNAVENRL